MKRHKRDQHIMQSDSISPHRKKLKVIEVVKDVENDVDKMVVEENNDNKATNVLKKRDCSIEQKKQGYRMKK